MSEVGRPLLPRWTVPLVAAVALIAAAVVLVLLWRWIDGVAVVDVEKKAAVQMEAVKVASGIVVAGGGLFALYLAARRQRTQELELEVRRDELRNREVELAQRDRVQIHAEQIAEQNRLHVERVAEDTRRDAAERRVTALYAKAADQLGSEKAPVRLAGLYALERLGQSNPDHRQTIFNVICAYLRMPYIPPERSSTSDEFEQNGRREELHVRLTAQRVLADHLRDETYVGQRAGGLAPETFWPDITMIDLRGADLIDFHLIHCSVRSMQFHNVTFEGETLFRGTICDSAFFQGAAFGGHADFRGTVFTDSWFSYATFDTEVWFHGDEHYPGARFGRHVSFQGGTFTRGARFNRAIFSGSANFDEAGYECGAETIDLAGAHVEDPNAVSPDVTASASSWPPGWNVELGADDSGTLVWRTTELHGPAGN